MCFTRRLLPLCEGFWPWILPLPECLPLDLESELLSLLVFLLNLLELGRVQEPIHFLVPLLLLPVLQVQQSLVFLSKHHIVWLKFNSFSHMLLRWLQIVVELVSHGQPVVSFAALRGQSHGILCVLHSIKSHTPVVMAK